MTSTGTGPSLPGDQATVSVFVAVEPDVAFDVFTKETDLWWQRGLRFRPSGRAIGALCLEPGVGGRLFETFERRAGTPVTAEFGRVTVWDPPARFVLAWRNVNFEPTDASTELEVLFDAAPGGTRVTVHHRGWAALRADHPARHGQQGAEFVRGMGLWWADLLTALREYAERSTTQSKALD